MIHRVYLIPHGDELIDLPNEASKEMREAIIEETSQDNASVRIILTPHGLSLGNHFSIAFNKNLSGNYTTDGGKNLQMKLDNDLDLANLILRANQNVLSKAFFSGGEQNTFPIDFGSMIPLTFFNIEPAIIIGQARLWDLQKLYEFGRNIYRVLSSGITKYSIIFSADQAHTHNPEGPYGFTEEAKVYDKTVKEVITTGRFGPLYEMKRDFIESAKPDSYWIMVVLGGFLSEAGIKLHIKGYYVERYFGMLFACNADA
jgi:aromatic ring-opening dioxygenase LigB subunit